MDTSSNVTDVPDRYRTQLSRQLGFVRRSAQLYDEGYTDEAIRMAASIRALIHSTSDTPSLLRLLGAEKVTLASTCAQTRYGSQLVRFMGLGTLVSGSEGASRSYKPFLSRSPAGALKHLPVQEWWEQTVYVIESIPLTRKNIVLMAANKNGGTQVDPKVDPRYTNVSRPGNVGTITSTRFEGMEEERIPGAHLVALRQMAYEVLNSPDLLNLADSV